MKDRQAHPCLSERMMTMMVGSQMIPSRARWTIAPAFLLWHADTWGAAAHATAINRYRLFPSFLLVFSWDITVILQFPPACANVLHGAFLQYPFSVLAQKLAWPG